MKKFLSLALCLCMILGVSAPAVFATANDEPTPYWVQTETAIARVRFSNGNAIVSAEVRGVAGTNKIVATLTLEKKNANGVYAEIATWQNRESYSETLNFSGQYAVSRGEFRVTVTAAVTKNGATENVSSTGYATY